MNTMRKGSHSGSLRGMRGFVKSSFHTMAVRCLTMLAVGVGLGFACRAWAQDRAPVASDGGGQPVGANVGRLIKALEDMEAPLAEDLVRSLKKISKQGDEGKIQELLDEQVLLVVDLNPEGQVKVNRGPGKALLQQGGFTPLLVKINHAGAMDGQLRIVSPQAGPVYAGASIFTLERMVQTELNDNENTEGAKDRFLVVEMFQSPPMSAGLGRSKVEYAIALIYSSEAGKREARIGFGFESRAEAEAKARVQVEPRVKTNAEIRAAIEAEIKADAEQLAAQLRTAIPVSFDVRKASVVRLAIKDADGQPTTARLIFRDKQGRVYPTQTKRLAPDLFFQPQIYRRHGDVVVLPPGKLNVEYCRGPEYLVLNKGIDIGTEDQMELDLSLKRWVDPMEYGFYNGDHHFHASGCAHYSSPTEGITPEEIFLQVKGEGLNVGCVLAWFHSWEYQHSFFEAGVNQFSEPLTLMKYDMEISGFGSAGMGHVVLLNLKSLNYPGTDGKVEGWPTWTVPALRWCKEQGGVTGYPHSSLRVNPEASSKETLAALDADGDGSLSQKEAGNNVLPAAFEKIDSDNNLSLSGRELLLASNEAVDQLPNFAIPSMTGGGALEIFVSTPAGVCDFISAMDTERIGEWNIWYHLMNCGFPLKVSGESDYPCMSSRRVGQGRVYVQLGKVEKIDFSAWCEALRSGQSYVSDGYAHALEFQVNGVVPGKEDISLDKPAAVQVEAKVAFAPETPDAVAYGQITPAVDRRLIGDTVHLHAERTNNTVKGGSRLVEIVVNGHAVASQYVPADGKPHDLKFEVQVDRSSWLALRHFPQLHTNPVNVMVAGEPIRASRSSALYCAEAVKRLWKNRSKNISEAEKEAAEKAYQRAIKSYEKRAAEAPEGS